MWRDCINVAHLEPVLPIENWLRGNSVTRLNAVKECCGACGRPYDLANTYWYRGRRDCRACIRRRTAEYKKRQQAQIAQTSLAAAA